MADTMDFQLRDDAQNLLKTFSLPMHNLEGTAPPSAANDGTQGYGKGSMWVDKTNQHVYQCVANATGAAVWLQLDGSGGPPTGAAGGDLAGSYPNPTVASTSGAFNENGVIAVLLSANQNNWAPTGLSSASVIRVSSTSNFSVTGIDSTGVTDGRVVHILNVNNALSLVFAHGSTSSLIGNRFYNPNRSDLTIRAGEAVAYRYSTTTSRWECEGLARDFNGSVTEAQISLSNVTSDNVTSTAHGFAPVSPADATQFLNGAATPAWAQVKDSDLSTSNITTNDVSTTKHGFCPKAPNNTTQFLRADATWAAPTAATPPAYAQDTGSGTTGFATDTYVPGSGVAVPATGVQVGTRYKVTLWVSKTAAGTAAPSFSVRWGTAGTTADSNIGTIGFPAQTAVADEGTIDIYLVFRTVGIGTAANLGGQGQLRHRLTTTGLSNAGAVSTQGYAGVGFNSTLANAILGVSLNAGASASWTVTFTSATLENLP